MLGDKQLASILQRSMDELRLKTASHIEAWRLDDVQQWRADLDEGVIWFTNPGFLAVAPVQVVGTYTPDEGTWLWGWDHPSVPPDLARDATLVREFGEDNGLSRYTNSMINCTEDEAWQFTALACHLAGASGAYRGPADPAFVFMTFHDLTIRSSKAAAPRDADA